MNALTSGDLAIPKFPPIFASLFGRRHTEVLESSDELINELMHSIYLGRVPVMQRMNTEEVWSSDPNVERFLVKHSNDALHEWAFKGISSVKKLLPYNHPSLMREIYESPQVKEWSNEDDFSFYEYVGIYNGRRIRVIFYNSLDRKEGRKLSYNEWESLGEYASLRICMD